jgi:MtrB/PioB family decaheme-associated outer membrane protein
MPGTTATFKVAYTHATQHEDFLGMGLSGAPSGRSNLGGEINTTLVQLGLTTRPMKNLSVVGNVRYEDKDNKTPIDLYNIEGANRFTNDAPSPKKFAAKLEASYQLPMGYRGTLGGDYEKIDHGDFSATTSVAGLSGLRQKTEETGYRVELRRNMSETLTGWVSFGQSRREGDSPWLKPLALPLTGVIEANPDGACVPPAAPALNPCIYNRTGIFPFIFEDRKRDKGKAMVQWTPMDNLSLQFFVDAWRDTYHGPTQHGLRDASMRVYSLDADYALSDRWKLTAYVSRGDSTVHSGHSTGYDAELKDTADSFGIALKGRISERLQVGADLTFLDDRLKYYQTLDELASAVNIAFFAAAGGLPDVTYRLIRTKLYGEYAIDSNSSVRLDLVHHRTKFNEWTYQYNGVPFAFSDNTTLSALENQNVTFVGVRYIYRWR